MKNLKKLLGYSLLLSLLVLTTSCSFNSGEQDAKHYAKQMLDDFNSDSAVSYYEKFDGEKYAGEFTYKRDANGNVLIIDEGIAKSDNSQYYYEDYKIGDTYYEIIDGELRESVTTETFEPVQYFKDQAQYVSEGIDYAGVDTLSFDVDYDFSEDDTYYIATGEYEDDSDIYTLKISKDGKTMIYSDSNYYVEVSYDFNDTIQLPQ